MKFLKFFSLIFLLLFAQNNFATVKIKPLSGDFPAFNNGRKTIDFTRGWKVYVPFDKEAETTVDLPVIFTEADELIFEKNLNFTQDELDNYNIYLNIDGINYTSEFFINDQSFLKYPYGGVPVKVLLPEELLSENSVNVIKIKVNAQLDAKETIPTKQRFLFPDNFAGIYGNVFLSMVPKEGIDFVDIGRKFSYGEKYVTANLAFNVNLIPGTSRKNKSITLSLLDDSSRVIFSKTIKASEGKNLFDVRLKNPRLFSPASPFSYKLIVELKSGGVVLDSYSKSLPLYDLTEKSGKFFLNGEQFVFNGVEYTPFSTYSNETFSYKRISEDLDIARELGFNAIRFAHEIPNRAILSLLRKKGLFAFVEIPDNFVPSSLLGENNFGKRIRGYSDNFINFFSQFPVVVAIGGGSMLRGDSPAVANFISGFAEKVHRLNKLSYATFLAIPENIKSLDLVGVELYSQLPSGKSLELANGELKSKLFLTGTYPAFEGNREGYLYENSFDAQGKFFRDLFKIRKKLSLNGLFFNTLVDYSGEYASLYSSFDGDFLYKIGIVGVGRKASRAGYKVISEKLKYGKNVSLPLGKDEKKVPLFFIIMPLFLAVLVGGLLNSRRKFREDAKRALFRSYNFFADIRDQRLLSGFHSYFMMIISSGTISLLIVNLLFFWRGNIALERIILSFGNFSLVTKISYLAWRPLNAFLILWIAIIFVLLAIAFLVKFFSVFNRTRVLFANIFYTITWAIMPVTLLLALELLYLKILYMNQFNLLIYLFTAFYMLWLLMRMLKGFYVIFEVRPSTVYIFALGVIIFFAGGFFLYYQITADVFVYLKDALAEIKYF